MEILHLLEIMITASLLVWAGSYYNKAIKLTIKMGFIRINGKDLKDFPILKQVEYYFMFVITTIVPYCIMIYCLVKGSSNRVITNVEKHITIMIAGILFLILVTAGIRPFVKTFIRTFFHKKEKK